MLGISVIGWRSRGGGSFFSVSVEDYYELCHLGEGEGEELPHTQRLVCLLE